jgi:NlpC/P60 family putative phage cell wall peptidase
MQEEEAVERARVIAEARTWLGTPFRDQADVKGAGVDCAMLIIRAFVDTGMTPPFDPRPYPPRWFLHQGEERFLGWMQKYGIEIEAAAAQPGDIVIYRFGRCFSHSALIVSEREILHAYFKEGKAAICERFQIELTTMRDGSPRPARYFDFWAKRRLGAVPIMIH